MRKFYLSLVSLSFIIAGNAQTEPISLAPKSTTLMSSKSVPYNTNHEKITIWSNDVSVAADWAFTNTSTPAQDWYIETDPTAIPSDGPATMTTASNGFLMIDSDGAGSAGNQNAFATFIGGVINLSGQSNVTIEFEQHYRTYLDQRSIEISNDGGVSWTSYNVTDGSEPGGTVVSNIGSIDISATAANQANVAIRFHYIGNWGWHWAVDDIVIKTTDPYDLRAESAIWGVNGSWGTRMTYYSTPTSQIQPITFCGISSNIGYNDISDATYSVDITSEGYSSTGVINSISGNTDTICVATGFTPTSTGTYIATSGVSTATNTESNITNNDFTDITFNVNSFLYSRDNSEVNIDGGTFNSGNGFESGNIFDIFTDADLYSIRVGIHSQAVENATIFMNLYSIDPSTGNFILEDQTGNYTLTTADLGNYVDLPLAGGAFTLTAGESYLITAGSNGDGGLSNDLVLMTSGFSEPQTTFFYDATSMLWTYSTSTPAIQMNFEPQLSIEEYANELEMVIYPNPTNYNSSVSFSLKNTADVSISITELSGKVLYVKNLGQISPGITEVPLNTTSLPCGIYMINATSNHSVSTKKLIVSK